VKRLLDGDLSAKPNEVDDRISFKQALHR